MRLFLFLILFSLPGFADVTVVTYNMAQLRKNGIDLVACTSRRLGPQIEAMFHSQSAPLHASENFVYLIQEAWTKKTFRALKEVATEKKLTIFPDDFNVVKKSGQIILTNLTPLDVKSIPFSKDKYAKKGIVYGRLALPDGRTFGVMNVHTGYSDQKRFSDEHRRHFEELGRAIEELKGETDLFAVGGDFNAGPDMDFKKARYDSKVSVWESGLMPHMRNLGMNLLPSVGVTWDEASNELVRVPPVILRLVNKYKNGYTGWDQKSSTLDHIFVAEGTEVGRHERVFDEKVPLNCGKRDDEDGLLHLSDHFGVMAVIRTDSQKK